MGRVTATEARRLRHRQAARWTWTSRRVPWPLSTLARRLAAHARRRAAKAQFAEYTSDPFDR